jgi:hypothetical protein
MTTANLINDRIYTTIQKKLEKTSQDELWYDFKKLSNIHQKKMKAGKTIEMVDGFCNMCDRSW